MLYLNYAAQDPALTNEKCNFWHFRFDAHVDMKLEAITNYIAQQKIDQEGLPAQSGLRLRPGHQPGGEGDAGEEASGHRDRRRRPASPGQGQGFLALHLQDQGVRTETVITGNWGTDFTLLIKASKDSGLGCDLLHLQCAKRRRAELDRRRRSGPYQASIHLALEHRRQQGGNFANDYHRKYKDDFYYNTAKTELEMLARAMNEAKSTDPLKVAKALEGMKYQSDTGRSLDARRRSPVDAADLHRHVYQGGRQGRQYDVEGTGYGWKTDIRVESKDTVLPTTCKMERP